MLARQERRREAGSRPGARCRRPRWCLFPLLAATLVWIPAAGAQTELNPSRLRAMSRASAADVAILEAPDERDELSCKVDRMKPQLAFDLRFHAGYRVTVPLKELGARGDFLRVLMRVTPVERPENRIYLVDRFSIPPLEEAKGEIVISGRYALGPGRYKVDWLLRSRSQKVCSAHWDAKVENKKDLPLAIAANTAGQLPRERFREQAPIEREGGRLLHVKILANFSPSRAREATLKPWDLEAMVSILRGIARQPWVGRFSLVAFNMQEERVIYREDNVEQIDFPALGEAVESVRLGVVDYSQLLEPESARRFLTELLTEHLGSNDSEPDAIMIVGPKLMLEKKISTDLLKEAGRARGPIFYLNYDLNRYNPWRDAIGSALKVYQGLEYTIRFPRDLGAALTDMALRISKLGS